MTYATNTIILETFDESGQFHSYDDEPALITVAYSKWFHHGRLHRLDGPAIEYFDGKKEWVIDNHFCYNKREFQIAVIKFLLGCSLFAATLINVLVHADD